DILENPVKCHQGRRHTEREHIGETVILVTEGTLGVGHSCYPPIQSVENHGDKDRHSGGSKVTIDAGHHREEASKQGGGGKQVRQQVDALAPHLLTVLD